MSMSGAAKKPDLNQVKLLLHGECGLPPYLSPHLLSRYFPPESDIVRNHLIVGIEVRDSCISPVYDGRPSKKSRDQKRRRLEKTESIDRSTAGRHGEDTKQTRPTGYTFVGRSTSNHLCIPTGYETIACPTFDLMDSCKSKGQVSVTSSEVALNTPNGYQKLSCKLLFDAAHGLEVANCVSLFDQISSPAKRTKKSNERTISWLKQIHEYQGGCPKIRWWAPVVGGEDLLSRGCCLDRILEHKGVYGLALIGIHHIKARDLRKNIMLSLVKGSPSEMPKALLVANDICQILDAAQCGIRVVGSSLPAVLARRSTALTVDLHGWDGATGSESEDDREEVSLESDQNSSAVGRINVGREGTTTGYITLDEQVFVRDPSPFLKGCSCIACVNHTRSYVHHLINANEILAEILIFNHNLHHLLKMFEQISLALEAGSLDKFQRYIESQLSE